MPVIQSECELSKFRSAIHQYFSGRADASMELLDALCSNQSARSVVELSLSPLFRRGHDSLFKAIQEALAPLAKQNLLLDAFQTPEVEHEQYWLSLVILAYVPIGLSRAISQWSRGT